MNNQPLHQEDIWSLKKRQKYALFYILWNIAILFISYFFIVQDVFKSDSVFSFQVVVYIVYIFFVVVILKK